MKKIEKIELYIKCLVCDKELDGETYLCEIHQWSMEDSIWRVPKHIPEEQHEQYLAKNIIKNKEEILNEIQNS